jgi:hypothetical protein
MENRLQVSTHATTIYARRPARCSDAVHAEVCWYERLPNAEVSLVPAR